jgi:hypothetical protein
MVRRPDAVLAAIPTLAGSGVLLERAVPAVAATGGVREAATALPLWPLGFLAALLVVVYALFLVPPRGVRGGDS